MKPLILHVGLHKTATSSIQQTLHYHRGLLRRHGWWVPRLLIRGRPISNHGVVVFNAYTAQPARYRVNAHLGLLHDLGGLQRSCRQQLEALQRVDAPRVILSGESIPGLSGDELERLRDDFAAMGFEVRPYCALRESLSYATSLVQQNVRGGGANLSRLRQYGRGCRVLVDRIERLRAVFPDTRFLSFERSLAHPSGPVGYFLEAIGVPAVVVARIRPVRANESIGDASVRLIDRVNREVPFLVEGRVNPRRGRDDVRPLLHLPGPRFRLRADEVALIEPRLEAENALYAALLGGPPPVAGPTGPEDQDTRVDQAQLARRVALLPPGIRDVAARQALELGLVDRAPATGRRRHLRDVLWLRWAEMAHAAPLLKSRLAARWSGC
jgi:hypothetical protein